MIPRPINYKYIDGSNIDHDLICTICTEPYQFAVLLDCGHIFCQHCIDQWIGHNASCPICRHRVEIMHPYLKITRFDKRLDRLLVQCAQCNRSGFVRRSFERHLRWCSKTQIQTLTPEHLLDASWNRIGSEKLAAHFREGSSLQQRIVPHPNTASSFGDEWRTGSHATLHRQTQLIAEQQHLEEVTATFSRILQESLLSRTHSLNSSELPSTPVYNYRNGPDHQWLSTTNAFGIVIIFFFVLYFVLLIYTKHY